jgi:hypothetical protein
LKYYLIEQYYGRKIPGMRSVTRDLRAKGEGLYRKKDAIIVAGPSRGPAAAINGRYTMDPVQETPAYETLSPWAEVDPVSPRGLTAERPADLAGKTIGLYHIWKRASRPLLEVLERELARRYPSATFKWYQETQMNTPEAESVNKGPFEDWLKELDTVIFAYGD